MSLDPAKLSNIRTVKGKTVARCPACAEIGADESGEHLFINRAGKFGCVANPGDREHRRRIHALAGTDKGDPQPKRKPRQSRTWATPETAARSCTPKGFTLAALYAYPRAGTDFAAVARYESGEGKTFKQFSKNGAGWIAGGPSGLWPLYRVEALPEAGRVFIVEGEKAHAAAVSIGLPCVTSAGGSGAASKSDWQPLAGRDVAILPDADEPGAAYAADVSEILAHLEPPARVRVVTLPGLPESGDIADFLDARDAAEPEALRAEIEALADAAPVIMPPEKKPEGERCGPVEAAQAGKPYPLTDLGNAERFAHYHAAAVRWDVALKSWRVWDGRRWAVDSALNVNRLAAETVRKIRQEAAAAPAGNGEGKDLGALLFAWAVKSESRDRLAALLEVAKSQPGIAVSADALDVDPWALNVLNGTLDLRTGELRPHNRADLLTKLAPVEYRPGARDDRWNKFLNDATGGDADLAAFLQAACGYTLTGDTSEEKLFIVYGPTAGGKSTFLDAQRAALGDYARTIQADLLAKRRDPHGAGGASPELAALAGARLAAGSEMEQGREIAEALAKNLTGGEPVTARHLYASLFDFRPQFKLWLAVNHCPRVSGDDDAVWRRILRIGFEHTVPPERRHKTLKPYLRDPAGGGPAVLAWAVEGCLRWQRDGLAVPPAVLRSTEAYRNESDPLAAFVEDCLTFTEGDTWTPWADLWAAYCEHAEENGMGERYRVAPKRLQDRLRARGCVSGRRHSGRGWTGVYLREGWAET